MMMTTWWRPLIAVLALGGVVLDTARAALPDPTRPPPGMGMGVAPGPGLVMGITAPTPPAPPRAAASSPAPRAPVATPRVQALQNPVDAPPGSASALIDGRLFRVGDRIGDAAIQEIRPDGVWLRLSRGGTQWLGLYIPVEPPAPESATAASPARKEP